MDQQQSMWGQGSIMAHRRRDKSAEASTESTDDMSEDENLFDFIGRELDQREEEAMRLEQQQQQQQKDNNGNNGNINDNQTQVGSVGYSQSSDNKVVDFTTMNDDYLSVADGINDSPHDETKHDASNNHDDNHVADKAIPIPRTTSKRRREYSVVKSTTPRFSFQSATKSAAATASNNKKSPMMEVVQHSVTSPLTATQSENQSRKLSKQRRMHRHSFRQSLDRNNTSINNGSAAVMTQVNNNMRELAFVPKFLANSRAAAGCANDAISSQLENNNDDDGNDNNDAKRKWGPMSSTLTASPHKQSNSGSNSRRSKAGGYLIQNLRSLRNNDQWMAMRLRVSMGGSSSALMSRKRRRSSAGAAGSGGGGAVGNLDPKQVATSQLDVTVMGATDGGSSVSNNQNESSIRLAYIHRYTASAAAVNNLTTPCYSWIVLPQSVIHEQSVSVGEGNVVGGSMLLQFRCYDAIVIHPRIAHVDTKGHSIPLSGLEEHERPLPTIICANVCEKYNDTMRPLPDVSFDMFFK